MYEGAMTKMPMSPDTLVIMRDPSPDCVHAQATLPATIVVICIFSIFVQMSEGLHFGVVPYVSRPALGVVSGMVGAGGNTGALISGQFIVKAGLNFPLDEGFIYLGIVIVS